MTAARRLPRSVTFALVVLCAGALGACLATRAAPPSRRVPASPSVPEAGGGGGPASAPAEIPARPRVPIPGPPPQTPRASGAPDVAAAPAPDPPPAPKEAAQPAPPRKPPIVRVRLSAAASAGSVPVAIDGAWTLVTLDGARLTSGRRFRGDLVLSGSAPALGGVALPRDGASLVPSAAGDLRVGARRYPGSLRVARSADGRVRADIEVPVESYLEGVVAGELPPDFPREARRVQAIVARTYLLSQPSTTWPADAISVDDSGLVDQEFVGIAGSAAQQAAVRDAVESTRGLVVFDGARPVRAWYHSTCGGHTCAAAPVFKVPATGPLSGVACTTCGSSKYYRWTAKIPGAKVVQAARLRGTLTSFRAVEKSAEGRALAFEVQAGGRTARVHAADFRLALGPSDLRSTWLDGAEVTGGDLSLSGRGWGHGVGLCQVGARGLAAQGVAAEAIVALYYPGATLRREW